MKNLSKSKFRMLIWFTPVVLALLPWEIFFVWLVEMQIPETILTRDSSRFSKTFPFNIITQLLGLITVPIIVALLSKRYKNRFIIPVYFCGIVGALFLYYVYIAGVAESYLVMQHVNSTFGLYIILIPVVLAAGSIAGIITGNLATQIWLIAQRYPYPEVYVSEKRKPEFIKTESVISGVLLLSLISLYLIYIYPETRLEKAGSVRTSNRRIEFMMQKSIAKNDYKMLSVIASNPKLSDTDQQIIYDHTLQNLNNDEKNRILKGLSQNSGLTDEMAMKIVSLEIKDVNRELAMNWGINENVFQKLYKQPDARTREYLLRNKNIPSHLVDSLSYDPKYLVRLQAVRNKKLSHDNVVRLTNDSDESVRSQATIRLDRTKREKESTNDNHE